MLKKTYLINTHVGKMHNICTHKFRSQLDVYQVYNLSAYYLSRQMSGSACTLIFLALRRKEKYFFVITKTLF